MVVWKLETLSTTTTISQRNYKQNGPNNYLKSSLDTQKRISRQKKDFCIIVSVERSIPETFLLLSLDDVTR